MANDLANGAGGAINGAAQGAAMGSIVPGIGTAVGAVLGGLGGLASGIMGGNAAEEAYKRRRKAYEEAIKKAQGVMDTAEGNLYKATDEALPELEQMRTDILDNNAIALNQGAGQLQAALQQQGVRGGQAATQLRRGIGDMTVGANQQINNMVYNDANQRRNLRSAYEAAKAQAATNAYLQPFQW